MRAILVLLPFLLSGCGIGLGLPDHDSRFDPIVEQFAKDMDLFDAEGDPFEVTIAFGDPEYQPRVLGIEFPIYKNNGDRKDGICLTVGKVKQTSVKALTKLIAGKHYGRRVVIINSDLKNASLEYLEALVYHELGHCVFNLNHTSHTSIMGDRENGVYSLNNPFRYFYISELMGAKEVAPDEILVSRSGSSADSMEFVFEVDYEAFGERISHRLYYDHKRKRYFAIEN